MRTLGSRSPISPSIVSPTCRTGSSRPRFATACEPEHAEIYAKRLITAMNNGGVQASIGWAMRDLNASLSGAFQEADNLMYSNKRARKQKRGAAARR